MNDIPSVIAECGFVFLKTFEPELSTEEAGARLGVPTHLEGYPLAQALTPKAVEVATPNTYSGNFGLGEFPLHTDLAHWFTPPRYFVLRCREGSDVQRICSTAT